MTGRGRASHFAGDVVHPGGRWPGRPAPAAAAESAAEPGPAAEPESAAESASAAEAGSAAAAEPGSLPEPGSGLTGAVATVPAVASAGPRLARVIRRQIASLRTGRLADCALKAVPVMTAGCQAAGLAFRGTRRRAVRLPGAVRSGITAGRLALARIRPAVIGAVATWTVAGVTLFVCYLHVSRTAAVTSDGASNALQAWDMLHHNLLLRGWQLSDVSFYTTELPQYMLIERLRGLTPEVVHIASAMTYTLLVLLAALLAKGKTTGREAMVRCLIAAGIMLAPQIGNGVSVLIGAPDHVGSAVPVLVVFVLIDRAKRRWYLPVASGLMLGWALVADGIVLYTGILPVIAVSLARAYQTRFRLRHRWRQTWFELALASAALAAIWLAGTALRMISARGGFALWPLSNMLASAGDLPHYLTITGRGLLLLFGANFLSHGAGFVAALAGLHLLGLGLAAWGTCAAIRRFPHCDPAGQLLAIGILITLAAFGLGTRAQDLLSARDMTAVLPFGAAVAGRLLAGRLASARLLPVLAVAGIGYLISLGRVVTQPPVPPQDAPLAAWLVAHRLTYGLAGYWDANITTLDSADRVKVRSALADGLQVTGDYWEVRSDWYQPRLDAATFIVLVPSPPGFKRYPSIASVRHTFGQPARIYYLGSYTILVWNKNLLDSLRPGSPPPVRTPAVTPPAVPIPAPPGG